MKVEPLDKGFTEVSLHFGFAEAPAVPAALEAHRAEFPIDIAETASSSGGSCRFRRSGQNCQFGAKSYTPSWAAMPSAHRCTSRFRRSGSSSSGHRSNFSGSV